MRSSLSVSLARSLAIVISAVCYTNSITSNQSYVNCSSILIGTTQHLGDR
jgi:hypothetical protein